ncbi:uncharacterized protein RSE6_10920 [Rhynchosporium secalis]|uniref:Uncharacterized protein n=1 Tax=Rhynchosporium secalis TaxID=38038 RepID=A0A1E1MLQ2_RHYSE|nr:uncharacterized protein RSE6_10920 [Rhynchosporium secalis]
MPIPTPSPRRILSASSKMNRGPDLAVDASASKEKVKKPVSMSSPMATMSQDMPAPNLATLNEDMPAPLRTRRVQSTRQPGSTTSDTAYPGRSGTGEAESWPAPVFASATASLNAAIQSGAWKVIGFSKAKPTLGVSKSAIVFEGTELLMSQPQVTTPTIKPKQEKRHATSRDEISTVGREIPHPALSTSKKHGCLNPTCEDVFDDTEPMHPNVYHSPTLPPKPPAKKRTRKKKPAGVQSGAESETLFREIPVEEIDLNLKSPKSPKTRQDALAQTFPVAVNTPTNPAPALPSVVVELQAEAKVRQNQEITQLDSYTPTVLRPPMASAEDEVLRQDKKKKPKKKKKGSTKGKEKEEKLIPPAIVRSPTLEERQEKMMQTFMLYDNAFQKQYERIKEEVLAAGGEENDADLAMGIGLAVPTPSEQDEATVKDLRRYGKLSYNPYYGPASSASEYGAVRNHAMTAAWTMVDKSEGEKKPITEFLQKESNVNIDVDNAAVERAHNFWDKPVEVLGEKGKDLKDLNSTFKAALDKVAGAKLNTMISGGRGTVNIQAGTLFAPVGGEEEKGNEDGDVMRLAMEKESQFDEMLNNSDATSEFKNAERILASDTVKENATAKTVANPTPLIARTEEIKKQAVTISHTPEELHYHLHVLFPKIAVDATWFTSSIISRIAGHPKLMCRPQAYNTDITTCVEHFMTILYPMFSMHDDSDASKVHIWVLWLNGCETLWRLIHEGLCARHYQGRYGLRRLDQTICGFMKAILPDSRDPNVWNDTVDVLCILTMWFIEEFHWAAGDFDVVIKSAEEIFSCEGDLKYALNHKVGTTHIIFPSREPVVDETIEAAAETNYDDALLTDEEFRAKMAGYGITIPQVLQILNQVIDGVHEIFTDVDPDTRQDDEKLAIQCFNKCAFALWKIIDEHSRYMAVKRMCKAAYYAAVTDLHSRTGQKIWLLRTLTLWFREQWLNTGGDLQAIDALVLKEVPAGDRDYHAFVMRQGGVAEWKDVFGMEEVNRTIPKVEATVPQVEVQPIAHLHSVQQAPGDMQKAATLAATPTSLSMACQKKSQGGGADSDKSMTIADFGDDIPQVIQNIDRIIENISSTTSGTCSRRDAEMEFVNCSYALWNEVRLALEAMPVTDPSKSKSKSQIESSKRKAESKVTNGLRLMCWKALTCIVDKSIPDVERVKLMMRLAVWFVLRWRMAGEDLGKVEVEALKEFPTGKEGWDTFPRVSLTELNPVSIATGAWKESLGLNGGRAVTVGAGKNKKMAKKKEVKDAVKEAVANLQKVTKSDAVAVSEAKSEAPINAKKTIIGVEDAVKEAVISLQKVVRSNGNAGTDLKCELPAAKSTAVPEAKCEVAAVTQDKTFEEGENFDESHESMEYIEPSAVLAKSISSESIPAEVNRRKVNGVYSEQRKVAAITMSGSSILKVLADREITSTSSINNNSFTAPKQDNTQDTDIDQDEDNMSKNTVPPTPPMTSEEFSAQQAQGIDLHAIQNTMQSLSHTLEQITIALYGTTTSINTSTEAINTNSQTDGLLLIANHLTTALKDAQTQIASVDSKLSTISTAITDLHSDNALLKTSLQQIIKKMDSRQEKERQTGITTEDILRQLLSEFQLLKKDVEILNRKDVFGDKEKGIWMEKAEELNAVVERAREVGGLSEVLWPQGDGDEFTGGSARGEVKSECAKVGHDEGEREKGRKRDLYVKVGHRAGRGQGGGGFCGVM